LFFKKRKHRRLRGRQVVRNSSWGSGAAAIVEGRAADARVRKKTPATDRRCVAFT